MKKKPYIIYLAWAPYNRRAECFAKQLDAELCLISYFKYRSPKWVPIKYPLMAIKTLVVLSQKRPTIIFAMSPPLFCALFVFLWCLCFKSRFVIDAHTGSLISKPWIKLKGLHQFLCRRAIITIVTNPYLVQLVESWGSHSIAMNPPIVFPERKTVKLRGNHNVLFVNSFASDEPLTEILEAAKVLPNVNFYITGDCSIAPKKLINQSLSNVIFTDFIPYVEYIQLMQSVDGILCFSKRDYTLLSGGEEALFIGKPLLTFDFPFLKQFFSEGTVFVEQTVKSIHEGVQILIHNRRKLEKEMLHLQRIKWDQWKKDRVKLNAIIEKELKCVAY
jgi:hypothetical protein